MYLHQFMQVFPAFVNSGTVPFLWGPPGIGKTSIAKACAGTLAQMAGLPAEEVAVVLVDAHGREGSDMNGVPIPAKDAEGRVVTRLAMSDIAADVLAAGKEYGILILDDVTKGPADFIKAIRPTTSEHRIGKTPLPHGWQVILTSNRAEDNSGDLKLGAHNMNAVSSITIETHIGGLQIWQRDNGIHHSIIAATGQLGLGFFADKVPREPRPHNTPRSLTLAARFLAEMQDEDGQLPLSGPALEVLDGFIGDKARSSLVAFLKNQEHLPSPEQLKYHPDTVKVPPASNMGAQFMLREMCVSHAIDEFIEPVWTVCQQLVPELVVGAACDVMRNTHGKAAGSPSFTRFLGQHSHLVATTI